MAAELRYSFSAVFVMLPESAKVIRLRSCFNSIFAESKRLFKTIQLHSRRTEDYAPLHQGSYEKLSFSPLSPGSEDWLWRKRIARPVPSRAWLRSHTPILGPDTPRKQGWCIWRHKEDPMRPRTVVWMVILSLVACVPTAAQTISGSIAGTVVDSQGAAVAQATVTIRNIGQNTSTTTKTNSDGGFVVPDLPAGRYAVTVEKEGFKKFEKSEVILDAFTKLDVGTLTLQVGAVTETVSVTAQGLQLQTESGERSTTIIGQQIENFGVPGRTPLALLKAVPGLRTDLDPTIASLLVGNVNSNGSRGLTYNLTLNGAANQDMGGNNRALSTLSQEAISEFKVLTSSYDAQFGRSSGAQIILVTKSGTADFHGEGYWYYRDKSVNANSWDNNRSTPPRPKGNYHFNYAGYNIGGPVYIPGKFNTDKKKVFFFWSDEYQPQIFATGQHRITVPTAQERLGNLANPYNAPGGGCQPGQFLQINLGGGPQCQPLKVPAGTSLYQPGLAILGIYPLPNVNAAVDCPTDTAFQNNPLTGNGACNGYNYISQLAGSNKRHEQLLRIDSNLTQKWRLWGSYAHLVSDPDSSPYCPLGSGYSLCGNIDLIPGGYTYNHPGHIVTGNLTRTFSPTLINESQFNYAHRRTTILPTAGLNALSYSAFGITDPAKMLPTIFPPYPSWIPNVVFGESIGNAPVLRMNGEWAPFVTYASSIEGIDNLSKTWGPHLFQTGLYVQRMHKDQTAFVSTAGTYNFVSPNSTTPGDTGYGYGNAAYGLVSSFYQANDFANGQYRYTNVEPYVQDTWRVTPRVTLVYGLRFYWVQPQYDQALQTSNFLPYQWDGAQAPRLYFRCPPTVSCPSGQTAYDSPLDGGTGATARSEYIGRIVPGSGNLLNGIAQGKRQVGKYLYKGNGLLPGPRLGLTVDLTGHSNMILRAGAGIYYDRYQGNEIFNLITNPPTIQVPTLVNVPASSITLGAGATVPSGVPGLTAMTYDARVPATYNMSLGIQSKLPWATTLDVAYVGSMGRKLLYNWNINAVPYGADFLQANQDPAKMASSPNAVLGSNAYDANYLRRYRGYSGITMQSFGATSSYNSLQVTVDRRFARGLFLSANYTYSKCLTWASDDGAGTRIDNLSPRFTNWGRCSYDVPHNFNFNYIYPVPSLAAHVAAFNNILGRAVFGGWQVSGYTIFSKGTPFSVGYSFTGGLSSIGSSQITGTPDAGARIHLIGDPLAGTSNSPYNRLKYAAFVPPPVGDIGLGSPVNYLTSPGSSNWDMSLQKSFSLRERTHLDFRVDAFNVFNHTQFNGINSTVQYTGTVNSNGTFTVYPCPTNLYIDVNAQTCSPPGKINPSGFGTVSGARPNRILQTMIKLRF